MASTKVTTSDPELAITPETLAAIAKAVAGATLAATQREVTPPPTNAIGYLRADVPAFKYKKVFFCNAEQELDRLTPDEARLFNEIGAPGSYGPDKTWDVRIANDQLHVSIRDIKKLSVRMELPRSLKEILQVIVDEQKAVAA
jgi:hypothetical protein